MSNTVPSPQPASSSRSSTSSRNRRPSVSVSPALSPRVVPVPVPQRHGSVRSRANRASFDLGPSSPRFGPSSQSLSSSFFLSTSPLDRTSSFSLDLDHAEQNDAWLDITARDILATSPPCTVVAGESSTEEAVETLIQSGVSCLVVNKGGGAYGFFDYTDLNVFLLLVLQASQAKDEQLDGFDPRSRSVSAALRSGRRVHIGDLCDLSQKSPYRCFPSSTNLRTLLPLFASGIHRVAVDNGTYILTDSQILRHLLSLDISLFSLAISSPGLGFSLRPALSLPGRASVLDAMQVMSLQGLSVLGVLSGKRRANSTSSASSASSLEETHMENLSGVITARDCTSLVIPSEGKRVLGMSLEQLVKALQVMETAGQARGEERFPVHTINHDASMRRASHLILATASSRVFIHLSATASPTLSPVPSSSLSPSPSPSFISLSDLNHSVDDFIPGLPPPPPTHLSSHQVLSISDILSCLARIYHAKLTPPPMTLSPQAEPVTFNHRRFSEQTGGFGFESWRWASV